MTGNGGRDPVLGAVAACFILSGCGSLVLEVVCSRDLKLLFGSSTLAISTILVAYMLGLGLGGLGGGLIATRLRNGVRAYGLLEIGVGLYALAVPSMIGLISAATSKVLASLSFWPVTLARFFGSLALMLLPTLAMGATLPVLVETLAARRERFARHVGLLYGINTSGAVLGVLLATFVLFPRLGLLWSNRVGAILDIAAGAVALLFIAPRATRQAAAPKAPEAAPAAGGSRAWLLIGLSTYALVGFTALVYEVSWSRTLSMVTGSSIYAFSAMLAAFLSGIALGSLAGRRLIDRLQDVWPAYGLGLAALGLLASATMLLFGRLPSMFLAVIRWGGLEGSSMVAAGFLLSVATMLAPTLLLGFLFPLACRAIAEVGGGKGRAVGATYFANTIGSALGAFAGGFLLTPLLGLRHTIAYAAALNLGLGAFLLLARRPLRGPRAAAAGAALVCAASLIVAPPAWHAAELTRGVYYTPDYEIHFGIEREPLEGLVGDEILYYKDGLSATVSIHRTAGGLNLRVNGKVDASLADMSTQILSGHIPMLFGPPAEDVLIIGYASGISAGAAALYEPRRLDIVEIEQAVIEGSHFFDAYNHRPLERPFTRVIVEDGRNYMLHTDERYDVIISEPSNPWISGSSNLFTREFFHAARRALRPGGRLLQWIQLYGMSDDAVLSVLKAVHAEFPHVYGFLFDAKNTDFMMLATDQPIGGSALPRWDEVPESVRQDLDRIRIGSEEELWSLLRLDDRVLAAEAEQAKVENTDDSMYVELNAPWTIYESEHENWEALLGEPSGVHHLLDEAQLENTRLLGRLALAFVHERQDPLVGRDLIGRLGPAAEEVPEALAAEGLMQWRAEPERPGLFMPLFDRAVALDPVAFGPRYQRSLARYVGGDASGGLEDAEAAVRAHPDDHRAVHQRLRCLGALGRFEEALHDAGWLLERRLPDLYPRMYADVAVAFGGAGEYRQAARLLEEFLLRQPDAVREWRLLAATYARLGDAQAQARAERNAAAAARNVIRMEHRRALGEFEFGRKEAAIALLKRLVRNHPEYEPAARDLERLRTEAGGS